MARWTCTTRKLWISSVRSERSNAGGFELLRDRKSRRVLFRSGFLHLELNSHPERYGSLDLYDEETLDFFRSVGTVQRGVVRIAKGKSQEWGQNRKPA